MWTTTVRASGVSILATGFMINAEPPILPYRSRLAFTSALVIALPLWNVTPCRSVKRCVSPSALVSTAFRQVGLGVARLVPGEQGLMHVQGDIAGGLRGRGLGVQRGRLGLLANYDVAAPLARRTARGRAGEGPRQADRH